MGKQKTLVLFLLFLLIVVMSSCSRKKEKSLNISVKLEITGKGYYNFDRGEREHDDYFSKVTVTNNESAPVSFWMMNCSWWNETLVFDTDSMEFSSGGCDKNIPVEIVLKPGKSILFYPVFHDNSIYRLSHDYYVDSNNVEHQAFPVRSKDNKQIRMGFILMSNKSKDPTGTPPEFVRLGNIYWSNPVKLNHIRNNSYRVEE